MFIEYIPYDLYGLRVFLDHPHSYENLMLRLDYFGHPCFTLSNSVVSQWREYATGSV